jgi:hypothetical protein
MAGLGLLDRVDDNSFNANAITRHMVDMPSAQHGAVHLCVTFSVLFFSLICLILSDQPLTVTVAPPRE